MPTSQGCASECSDAAEKEDVSEHRDEALLAEGVRGRHREHDVHPAVQNAEHRRDDHEHNCGGEMMEKSDVMLRRFLREKCVSKALFSVVQKVDYLRSH